MEFELAYWHWIIMGAAMAAIELITLSFVALCFSVGAFMVALGLLIFPTLGITAQLLIWALTSLAFTGLWFGVIKPRSANKTKAGLALESIIGESGIVVQAPAGDRRGTIRFSVPKLGNDEWLFACEEGSAVKDGDRVKVTDINGNMLIVRPH